MSILNGFTERGFVYKCLITGMGTAIVTLSCDGDTYTFPLPEDGKLHYVMPYNGDWTIYQVFMGEKSNDATLHIPSDKVINLAKPDSLDFTKISFERMEELAPVGKYIWSLGDINNKTTGGLQLYHFLKDEQKDENYYNTEANIVVGISRINWETSYHSSTSSAQKYFNSGVNSTCTSIYNGLSAELKAVLKPWTRWVGKENANTESGAYGLYNQEVYLAAPSCKEVGASNTYNTDEDPKMFTFDYFKTNAESRRSKNWDGGSGYHWWLCSPGSVKSGYRTSFQVNPGGAVSDDRVNYSSYGVSPIMFI